MTEYPPSGIPLPEKWRAIFFHEVMAVIRNANRPAGIAAKSGRVADRQYDQPRQRKNISPYSHFLPIFSRTFIRSYFHTFILPAYKSHGEDGVPASDALGF